MDGRVMDGRVMDGRVMDGRVMDGRVMDGRVMDGRVMVVGLKKNGRVARSCGVAEESLVASANFKDCSQFHVS
jgi:hypothetical protein